MFFLPFGEMLIGNDIYSFNFMKIQCQGKAGAAYNQGFLIIGIALALSVLLCLITIFLYRKRLLQIKLCITGIILQALIIAVIYMYVFRLSTVLNSISYDFTVFFPFLSVILLYLAIRAIRKDEKLIRSVDRIR
jgi:hypothetical protein